MLRYSNRIRRIYRHMKMTDEILISSEPASQVVPFLTKMVYEIIYWTDVFVHVQSNMVMSIVDRSGRRII